MSRGAIGERIGDQCLSRGAVVGGDVVDRRACYFAVDVVFGRGQTKQFAYARQGLRRAVADYSLQRLLLDNATEFVVLELRYVALGIDGFDEPTKQVVFVRDNGTQ